jgi:arylsulfatase A-like enzyme
LQGGSLLNRRDFFKLSSTGVISSILFNQGCSPFITQYGLRKPNVLFISIDDLNDWIGCLGGHPDVKTPNLDRLAKDCVIFTNAHCPAPLCNASRTALMTGMRPSTSGVYLNAQPWRESPILKKIDTLPQHFKVHNYTTLGSGKIYHDLFPDPPSWDTFWPSKKKQRPKDPKPENLPLNGIPDTRHFDWGPMDVKKQSMGDWQVANWIINQLNINHKRPFFMACGFYRPHLPWYVPREYFNLYPLENVSLPVIQENDLDDVPAAGKLIAEPDQDHVKVIKYNQWRKAVQAYLASISFVDECIGRVIDALYNSSYSDNTVIVLWSDHGWHLGEKLHWRKFALWEEATHNVLMFKAPEITKPGVRCNAPVNLLDIYPTLIDICGLNKKPELEGISLLPLLKDPDRERKRPALTTFKRNNHSIRSKRWRYIRYSDSTEELYDHSVDELEWNNLAEKPEYEEIKKDLAQWLPKLNAPDSPKRKKS